MRNAYTFLIRKKDISILLRRAGFCVGNFVEIHKEKRFGITLLLEDEEPEIYCEEDVIPVGLYNGELEIDMREIFAEMREV